MITVRELRSAATDTDVDMILRSHEFVCEEASETIDALLGLLHDSHRLPSTPIWASLDEPIKVRVEANVLRLAEEKASQHLREREDLETSVRSAV